TGSRRSSGPPRTRSGWRRCTARWRIRRPATCPRGCRRCCGEGSTRRRSSGTPRWRRLARRSGRRASERIVGGRGVAGGRAGAEDQVPSPNGTRRTGLAARGASWPRVLLEPRHRVVVLRAPLLPGCEEFVARALGQRAGVGPVTAGQPRQPRQLHAGRGQLADRCGAALLAELERGRGGVARGLQLANVLEDRRQLHVTGRAIVVQLGQPLLADLQRAPAVLERRGRVSELVL